MSPDNDTPHPDEHDPEHDPEHDSGERRGFATGQERDSIHPDAPRGRFARGQSEGEDTLAEQAGEHVGSFSEGQEDVEGDEEKARKGRFSTGETPDR
jgi:hypothetical protein